MEICVDSLCCKTYWFKKKDISYWNVWGEIGPVELRCWEVVRSLRPFRILLVTWVVWTVRSSVMGSNWIRGWRKGMVLSVTGGLPLKTPAMLRDRAIISLESMTGSSSHHQSARFCFWTSWCCSGGDGVMKIWWNFPTLSCGWWLYHWSVADNRSLQHGGDNRDC